MPPYKQLMILPQSKNQASNLNKNPCNAVEKAEQVLHGDGYKLSFINSANNGVACDFKFVRDKLFSLFERQTGLHTHN
eukprot:108035-Ditylum_brightwellii.AAC.1